MSDESTVKELSDTQARLLLVFRLSTRGAMMDVACSALRMAEAIAVEDEVQKGLQEILEKMDDLLDKNSAMVNFMVEEDD